LTVKTCIIQTCKHSEQSFVEHHRPFTDCNFEGNNGEKHSWNEPKRNVLLKKAKQDWIITKIHYEWMNWLEYFWSVWYVLGITYMILPETWVDPNCTKKSVIFIFNIKMYQNMHTTSLRFNTFLIVKYILKIWEQHYHKYSLTLKCFLHELDSHSQIKYCS
jgi:hypothetical protein